MKTTDFYKENKDLLGKKRAGYYSWKPCVILESMKKINKGDIIFYCDSGIDILSDPKKYIEKMDRGILVFHNGTNNLQYTKRDCFILMDCDKKEYWNAEQMVGGFNAWEKMNLR